MNWGEWAKGLLERTDELALIPLEPGTPCYELQQGLIKAAARYRLKKRKDDEENKSC